MPHSVRRVVTGHDEYERSVVARDGAAPMATGHDDGEARTTVVWATPPVPSVPSTGDPTEAMDWAEVFPGPGATRFLMITHPPGAGTTPVPASPAQDGAGVEFDETGMHASDTVDDIVVVSGRIWMELDDGQEVVLSAGEVLVLNGTRHGWRNRGDEDAVVAVVLIGAAPGA